MIDRKLTETVAPPDGGRYRRLGPRSCLARISFRYARGMIAPPYSVSTTPTGTTLSDQSSDAMATPIVIPQYGLVEEVVVLEWLRADGDEVLAGEMIVLLETEKTQTEVEAPATGTLRIAVAAGPDVIPVDTVLGEIA